MRAADPRRPRPAPEGGRVRRRRVLTILAAVAAAPLAGPVAALAQDRRIALGAETSLTLVGPHERTGPARAAAWAELDRIGRIFSLYDPESALSRLNRDGVLESPPPELVSLLSLAGDLHRLTGGRFDPSVQPLWQALARGGDTAAPRARVGWDGIGISAERILLRPGQALTLNGIAQGYATDRVTAVLADHGLTRALVDIGEFRAIGGPFRIGLSDPSAGLAGRVTLDNRAVATSSPGAMTVGGEAHILDPSGFGRHWSTVSVVAETATLADGLSTALCLAGADAARAILRRAPGDVVARAVTSDGDLVTL
ncbi:FAD:protein FMN transferase [Rhodobacterales bacterium HKCCE2091]|nr:FAD:protein FMN transferase [Rhodobacterales bacterium HKCCE2091]